jgi:hypothetical protein
MVLLLGAAFAQGMSLEVPVRCGDGSGVDEILLAVAVLKPDLGVRHPRIGFFFSDRLFGGLLLTSLAANRSRRLHDYVMASSRSRSTADQSSWILTLSIIGVMKDAGATCQ